MEWVRALMVMSRLKPICPGDIIQTHNGLVMYRAGNLSDQDKSEIGIYRFADGF